MAIEFKCGAHRVKTVSKVLAMHALTAWFVRFLVKLTSQSSVRLQNGVSELLVDLGKKHNWTNFVGLAGNAHREGRREVSDDCIEAMLDAEIVVPAQRDMWEDHCRLMEGLMSGSMVLHDFMHGLPQGLENGTSVVECTSPEDSESLLQHCLEHDEERMEIGRRGREVAMQRHRTWHRIQEVDFGEIISTCESKPPGGHCPYIMHANEN